MLTVIMYIVLLISGVFAIGVMVFCVPDLIRWYATDLWESAWMQRVRRWRISSEAPPGMIKWNEDGSRAKDVADTSNHPGYTDTTKWN